MSRKKDTCNGKCDTCRRLYCPCDTGAKPVVGPRAIHKGKAEPPMLITRKCSDCLEHGKSRNMEFKEAIRTWICPVCGHAERLDGKDDGFDADRTRGSKHVDDAPIMSLPPRKTISELSSGTSIGGHEWSFDPGYGAWRDPNHGLYDPKKPSITYYLPKCGHNMQRIKVGEFEVMATESCHVSWSGKREKKPDFGVYLSSVWVDKFPGVLYNDASCGCLGMKHPYPAIFVDWEDRKSITLELYTTLVNFVIEKLSQGSSVEIGCQGAHGRTGTLIAGVLGKLEHLDAAESVNTLRSRYCKKAVESKDQLLLIQRFLKQEGCDSGSAK